MWFAKNSNILNHIRHKSSQKKKLPTLICLSMPYVVPKKQDVLNHISHKIHKRRNSQTYMPFYALCGSQKTRFIEPYKSQKPTKEEKA